mmetsp:Transcript_107027/g.307890  ORF Transcript_107027/g.307890 Transcript_107027/m.307890 type:complete len:205 (-) Transcript_107027:646-1260(-)
MPCIDRCCQNHASSRRRSGRSRKCAKRPRSTEGPRCSAPRCRSMLWSGRTAPGTPGRCGSQWRTAARRRTPRRAARAQRTIPPKRLFLAPKPRSPLPHQAHSQTAVAPPSRRTRPQRRRHQGGRNGQRSLCASRRGARLPAHATEATAPPRPASGRRQGWHRRSCNPHDTPLPRRKWGSDPNGQHSRSAWQNPPRQASAAKNAR